MLRIATPVATKKAAQDAPRATIGTSGDLQVHPISSSLLLVGVCTDSTSFTACERLKRVWTLTSLWTHRTRPQVTWKTADSFPQRPHPSFFYLEEERRTKSERQKQRNPTVHQIGSGPRLPV
jgi:hypothetical protein